MRRLLALTIPSPVRQYQNKLGNQAALALMEAPHESVSAVLEDAATAAIAALMGEPVGTRRRSRACASTSPATSPA